MSILVRTLEQKNFHGWTWTPAEWRCSCGTLFEAPATSGDPPLCRACAEKAQIAREHEQRRARLAAETLASIPPRFRWASFDAPEMSQRVRPASIIERARELVATGGNVVLLGDSGSGKTSLAIALLRAIADDKNTIGRFFTSFELAEARRQSRLGAGEAPAVDRAARAGIIVLDELAAEMARDTGVDEVIRRRHDHNVRTIYTSGFDRKVISDRYGSGVERRIFEGATVLRLGK